MPTTGRVAFREGCGFGTLRTLGVTCVPGDFAQLGSCLLAVNFLLPVQKLFISGNAGKIANCALPRCL